MGEQQAIHESTHPLPHEPAASAGWKVGITGLGEWARCNHFRLQTTRVGWGSGGVAGPDQAQWGAGGGKGQLPPGLDCSSHLFPQGWAAGEREKEGLHADVGAHGPEPAAPSQARMCFP